MAGIRTRARGYVLQVLYALDVNENEVNQSLLNTAEHFEVNMTAEGKTFAAKLVEMAQSNHENIDTQLQLASQNWRVARMSTVDRNIMRLATAELLYDESVPTRVIINEAIELAKRFGTAESASFVNGILDRVATQTRG